MICAFCNNKIEDGSKFCPCCGKPVASDAPTPTPEVSAEPKPSLTAEPNEQHSIVSVLVFWAISTFMAIMFFVLTDEDTPIDDELTPMLIMFCILSMVFSLIAFLRAKYIYQTEQTRQMQIIFAVSIVIFILAGFLGTIGSAVALSLLANS